jgi:hypothetical protein
MSESITDLLREEALIIEAEGATGESVDLLIDAADEITTLRQQLEQAQAESVQAAANKVCGELPECWVINLCMENGAAWVEAIKPSGYTIDIDRGDLSLVEQIDEALRLADEAGQEGA